MLHRIPMKSMFILKPFNMGGLSSVSTWSEYRRQVNDKKLLFHVLNLMKAALQTITFLHPFSFGFYRQYGFEHTFNLKHYTIPVEKMAGRWQGKGYVRRSELDIPTLNAIYSDYAKRYTGTIMRDDKWWK